MPRRSMRTPLPASSSPFFPDSPCTSVSSTFTSRVPKHRLDLDLLEEEAPKRAKKDVNSVHVQWGRILARVIDAYNNPKLIVATGLRRGLAVDKSTFSEEQQMQSKSFDMLTRHIPALDGYLGNHVEPGLKVMCEHMRIGQASARSDDTSALKKEVVDMLRRYDHEASRDLKAWDKSNRGFNHPLTGRLLCPAKLDYSDETLRDSLKFGKYDLSPTDWPTFFYANYKYNPEDEFDGLLKSELLVQAYKCIFLGPSAWGAGKTKATRSPKAALCEMENVTTRSLAYVAVLTYFSLSSDKSNQKRGGSFNLSALYWQIVSMLEDDELKEEADELLLWWNKHIFPSKSCAKSPAEKASDPIARMKAQKAAKRAAAALQDTTSAYNLPNAVI